MAKGGLMNRDKLTATDPRSDAGAASRRDVAPGASAQAGRHDGARRTLGVYERPSQRARLSLPLVVILILSALVSVVAAARFLF